MAAEPIRRVAPPAHRRPLQGARPQPRPRPLRWTGDETEASPLPQAPPAPPRPVAVPTPPETETRTWTRAFRPVAEKKLRGLLLAALAVHAVAIVLPFLLPAMIPAPSRSDTLLASAVLLAGGTVLLLGALGRRS
jgi:hypothetical protein